jgi:type IV pilus assembly protein PilN
MKVRLNLATKALETHRRFLVGSGLVAFFAVAAFLGLGWYAYSARAAHAELRALTEKTRLEMDKLESERKDLERYFGQKDIAELHDRAAFINTILDARGFNWTLMFMDLERILPGGVRVISIEPKQVSGRVELKLTVGTINDEAELKFEHALEESKAFTDVRIQHVGTPSAGPGANQNADQKVVQLTTVYSRS